MVDTGLAYASTVEEIPVSPKVEQGDNIYDDFTMELVSRRNFLWYARHTLGQRNLQDGFDDTLYNHREWLALLPNRIWGYLLSTHQWRKIHFKSSLKPPNAVLIYSRTT